MRELYELKDKLSKELKDYSRKDVTASSLTMIDTLAHAIKNIDKVIEKCEEEEEMYSGRPSFESGSMRGYGDMGGYSRGYSRGGSYRRDAMGRYSGHDEITSQLEDLMRDAPDERTKQKIREIMSRM